MKINRNDVLFVTAIVLAVWFALTSWFWVYLANVFFSFPVGIISLILWLVIKKDEKKRNKVIPIILIIGLVSSLGALAFFA